MMLSSRAHDEIGNTQPHTLDDTLVSLFPFLEIEQHPLLRRLLLNAKQAQMPAASKLLQPDSPCEHFIMLLSGRVRVFQQTSDVREVTLYRIEAGNVCVLSINGMLQQQCFGAFAETETPVEALLLTRDEFFQAMTASARFCEYVLLNTSNHFKDLLELTQTTVFESLDTRLICLLGRMARSQGSDKLHITHQEMARELGTSREVISRLLKGLERRGCISLARGVVKIDM